MQYRGLLNYCLKFCWLKVICCIQYVNQTNLNVELSTQLGAKLWASQNSGITMAYPCLTLKFFFQFWVRGSLWATSYVSGGVFALFWVILPSPGRQSNEPFFDFTLLWNFAYI